jgi:hypothetical protein
MSTGDPRYIAPWTALGGPIVTQPIGHDAYGLPIGMLHAGGQAPTVLSPALHARSTIRRASAAAVGAGCVPLAVGTQTVASA